MAVLGPPKNYLYTPKVSYTIQRNMPGKMNQDIIEAAIIGYQSKISDLQQRIAELRSMLNGTQNARRDTTSSPVEGGASEKRGGGKRRMSAAAKRKLSLAAKKRWALLKRQHPNAKTLAG